MFITDSPVALPGSCLFCPGSVRKQYVDTELHWEFHGAVYICDECVMHMGRMFGMISLEQRAELGTEIDRLTHENYELLRQTAGLEAAISGLAAGGFVTVPQRRRVDLLPSDAQGQGGLTSGTGGDVPGEGSGVGTEGGAASESGYDEPLDRVHADDNSDGTNFRLSI